MAKSKSRAIGAFCRWSKTTPTPANENAQPPLALNPESHYYLIKIAPTGAHTPIKNARINNQITAPEVRVIDAEGKNLGVMPTSEALKLAPRDSGLDLIEISPTAKPPVARIMSFDKYRYEQEKLEKKQRQANKNTDVKRIQISARAAMNDLQVRLAKLEEFLKEGHPVEIVMRLKGREKANKDFAGKKLTDFMKMITTEYKIISPPKYAGNGFSAQITKKE